MCMFFQSTTMTFRKQCWILELMYLSPEAQVPTPLQSSIATRQPMHLSL